MEILPKHNLSLVEKNNFYIHLDNTNVRIDEDEAKLWLRRKWHFEEERTADGLGACKDVMKWHLHLLSGLQVKARLYPLSKTLR